MCHIQLEYIYWNCIDSKEVSMAQGMTSQEVDDKIKLNIIEANKFGLSDFDRLNGKRILNKDKNTICPLCLEELSANGYYSKVLQAEGREVSDLTVTQLNLFHIDELRIGEYNHRPYNLGWGHHHCNVVVKDSGIDETLKWMSSVIERNKEEGYNID